MILQYKVRILEEFLNNFEAVSKTPTEKVEKRWVTDCNYLVGILQEASEFLKNSLKIPFRKAAGFA